MAADIDNKIIQLQHMEKPELIAEWREVCGNEPPLISRSLLIRALAHKWQEQEYGGTAPADQQLLGRMLQMFKANSQTLRPYLQIKIGTKLRRIWRGRMYEVTSAADGFIYEDQKYSSLTKIADKITGTHWNGRAFFGFKPRLPSKQYKKL